MKIKLPANFGGLSVDGAPVELKPDGDGCVDVEDAIANELLSHGGVKAEVLEADDAADQAAVDKAVAKIRSKRKAGE